MQTDEEFEIDLQGLILKIMSCPDIACHKRQENESNTNKKEESRYNY